MTKRNARGRNEMGLRHESGVSLLLFVLAHVIVD
jgi:hypothetical protein